MDDFNFDNDFTIPSFSDKQPKQPSTSIKDLSGSWRSYDGHYITIIKINKNTYRTFHNDFNKLIHDLTFDGKEKFISSNDSSEATLSNNTLHFNTMDRKKKVKWYFIDHTYPKSVNISGLYQFSNSSELVDIVKFQTNKKKKTYDYLFVAYYSKINEAAHAANKANAVANAVANLAPKLAPTPIPITEKVDVGPIYNNSQAAEIVKTFIRNNPKYRGWVFTGAWHSEKEKGTKSADKAYQAAGGGVRGQRAYDALMTNPKTTSYAELRKPITKTVHVGPIYSNNEAATKVNTFIEKNPKYKGWVFTGAWHSDKGTSYAELRNDNKDKDLTPINTNPITTKPINTKPLSIDKTELFYVCDNMIFSDVHGSGIIFNNQIIWKSNKNYWKKILYPEKSDISGLWKSDTGHSIYIIRKNFNEHIIMHDNKNKTIETCTYIDLIKRNADDNDIYTLLEQVNSAKKSKDKQQIEYVEMQTREMMKNNRTKYKKLRNMSRNITRNSFYLSSRAIGGPGEIRNNQTYLVDNELRYNNIIWKKVSNSFPEISDISGKWKSNHANYKIYKNQLNPYIYDYSFHNDRDHYGHVYMTDQFVYFAIGNHRELGIIQNNNTRFSLQQGKYNIDKIK